MSRGKINSSIIQAISYGLNLSIHFIPSFCSLTRDFDFSLIVLRNLHGFKLAKCHSIYDRMGELIKNRLISFDCISHMESPQAAFIIKSCSLDDGLTLFKHFIWCNCLVLYRALPDHDLDEYWLTPLAFLPNELYLNFYDRTQTILQEYEFQYRNDDLIPTLKSTHMVVKELSHCPNYVPYLIPIKPYYGNMHINTFSDAYIVLTNLPCSQ